MKNIIVINDKALFVGGRNSFEAAEHIAKQCDLFSEDCEDEIYCEDEISCYNCLYRRWNQAGFECVKGALYEKIKEL